MTSHLSPAAPASPGVSVFSPSLVAIQDAPSLETTSFLTYAVACVMSKRPRHLPTTPAGPCGPTAPSAPALPCGPCGPGSPFGPAGPVSPFGPAAPVAPAAPVGPAAPAGPFEPFSPPRVLELRSTMPIEP